MSDAILTFDLDADRAIKAMAKGPARVQRATVRAMNRGVAAGRTLMAQSIARDMGLKSSDAKDAVVMVEATKDRVEARLRASLKRIPLIAFGARGPEPSRGKGRGVSYKIGTGGRGRIANAFIATVGQGGHRGVFVRSTSKRLPIVERFGPSVGHVFNKFRGPVSQRIAETFEARLGHELKFAESED